jgi:hypothetical protein
MLLLRRFGDTWMTALSRCNILDLALCQRPDLGKTGGEGGALFQHAFDQKPAAMAVKNMFNQR